LRSEGFRLCGWACLALYLSVACGGSAIAADPDRLLFVRPEISARFFLDKWTRAAPYS
jgi:hypothetical protein